MKKLNGILKLGVFALFVVLMASCKKDEDPYAAYTPAREAALIKEWKAGMKLEKLQLDSTSTGIYYIADTVKVGSGPTVKAGNTVTVKYTGMFLDGTVFDASANHSAAGTMTYVHKTNRMIQGWEEGIEALSKGASAAFLIPSAKAYGVEGNKPIIPPNEPLIFIIEVVDIK
ncbi:MAG TPA: FKBP-type peptidyl-prolyl cis-trans isomerase [Prolixibacteraceae bacterium]|jgi:FKBP-type peptidyl-prolyl cis-trans isomerase